MLMRVKPVQDQMILCPASAQHRQEQGTPSLKASSQILCSHRPPQPSLDLERQT